MDWTAIKATPSKGRNPYDDHWLDDEKRDKPMYHNYQPTEETLKALALPKQKNAAKDHVLARLVGDAILTAHMYAGRWTAYSRGENWHRDLMRIYGSEFTRENVLNAIDVMILLGLIVEHDRRQPGHRGLQSRYRVNPNLTVFEMPDFKDECLETIRLRSEGKNVNYKDTRATRQARKKMNQYNANLAKASIEFRGEGYERKGDWIVKDGNHVCLAKKSVYRVYTETFASGGRIYGGFWMQVSAEDRKHFYINGKATVEVDYEQLHPRMVYARAGLPLDGDAYTIPGYESERDLCKRAFNIMLNAMTYLKAKGALMEHMDGNGKAAERLIAAIKARHPGIHDYFHTGVGLKLQNLDADMCEFVLNELTVKRNIPVLSIHDSFLIAENHKELLVLTMVRAYEKFIGKSERRIVKEKERAVQVVEKTVLSDDSHNNTLPPLRGPLSCSSLSANSESESAAFNTDSTPTVPGTTPAHGEEAIVGLENQDIVTVETVNATVVEQEIGLQGRGEVEQVEKVSTVVLNEEPHLAATQGTNTAIAVMVRERQTEKKAIYRPRPQFMVREAERAERERREEEERKAKRKSVSRSSSTA